MYTGVDIPLNGDKKQTTNYKLSMKAYRTIDFSGNLRAYSGTFDSAGNLISWNHGISVNTSNLSLNTWKEYNYSFNTGAYSSWDYIYIDYDTENQGPVYVSDIRLDEYTTGTVTYDTNYTNLPTPTRTGYTFLGWYTGENGTGTKITSESTVSTASDHTLYAHWQPNTYYFDLNGYLDGTSLGNISGYGTADVYINGTLVCDDCTDYYAQHPYGTTYSITDIKATSGHKYNGIYSGSTSGTITGTTSVYLSFSQTSSIPTFTYTGSYQLVDDNNNTISNTSTWTGNWKIKFLTSGTFTSSISVAVDIFAVGGGGGGNASGGCGGFTTTVKTKTLSANTAYTVTVGAGGNPSSSGGNSSFGSLCSASGGGSAWAESGGSGGGGSGFYLSSSNHINGGNGGSNGSNGVNGWGTDGYHNGYGQGTTTREFGESSGTLYSGGGGGSGDCGYDFVNAGSGGAGGGGNGGFAFTNGRNGTANTGGGGGGGCKSDGSGYQGGYGGSGIVIIRNTKSSGNADAPMPTCTLSANATTITATVSTNGDSSIVYQGWNSTYSGTSSSSKSISVGMHTYYVKNKAGNTGECSAKVIATTENCECGAGFPQSGACYIGIIENGKWVGNRYYKECEYTYTCTSGTKINNSYCFKTY